MPWARPWRSSKPSKGAAGLQGQALQGAPRPKRELSIHADQHLVGTLGEDNDIWVLDDDPAWTARDDSFDLLPALPRTTARCSRCSRCAMPI